MKALVKAISYRMFGTLSTALISYAATGSAKQAMVIGGAEVSTKIILYYFHEKLWELKTAERLSKTISEKSSRKGSWLSLRRTNTKQKKARQY